MRHRFSATIDGGPANLEFTIEPLGDDRYLFRRGERQLELAARRLPGPAGRTAWVVVRAGRTDVCDVELPSPGSAAVSVGEHQLSLSLTNRPRPQAASGAGRAAGGPSDIKSPMPGKVVKILVNPGEQVVAGQGVVVVEAMKMENELRASRAGAVTDVLVKEGQAVEAGQTILRLGGQEPSPQPA